MRRYPLPRGNALYDFIASRLEMDHLFTAGLTTFLSVACILSLLAGIAVWPTVLDLKANTTFIGQIASNICTVGWISIVLCFFVTICLTLWQRREYSIARTILICIILLWIVFSITMIAQQDILSSIISTSFTTTLLWVMISPFLGYILAVLPAILISVIVSVVQKILDVVLPV